MMCRQAAGACQLLSLHLTLFKLNSEAFLQIFCSTEFLGRYHLYQQILQYLSWPLVSLYPTVPVLSLVALDPTVPVLATCITRSYSTCPGHMYHQILQYLSWPHVSPDHTVPVLATCITRSYSTCPGHLQHQILQYLSRPFVALDPTVPVLATCITRSYTVIRFL